MQKCGFLKAKALRTTCCPCLECSGLIDLFTWKCQGCLKTLSFKGGKHMYSPNPIPKSSQQGRGNVPQQGRVKVPKLSSWRAKKRHTLPRHSLTIGLKKEDLARCIAKRLGFSFTEDMMSAHATITSNFHRKLFDVLSSLAAMVGKICPLDTSLKQDYALQVLAILGIPCKGGRSNIDFFSTGSTVTRHFMELVYLRLCIKNR